MKFDLRVIKKYFSENLELLLVPVFFLLFILIIEYLWSYFNLPNQNDLINNIQFFFKEYGLPLIFVSSILESMLFIGWYFPGSLVIFIGVAATHGNPLLAVKTILVVCCGMLVGYSINYILGKFGWHKVLMKFGFNEELLKIEKKLKQKGVFSTFIFYIMPSFGSLLSTAFGVLKFNIVTFALFTIFAVVFWNIVWGVLVYHFGIGLFKLLTSTASILVIFCVYFFYMYNKQKESHESKQAN